jgi:hypothetical protein
MRELIAAELSFHQEEDLHGKGTIQKMAEEFFSLCALCPIESPAQWER